MPNYCWGTYRRSEDGGGKKAEIPPTVEVLPGGAIKVLLKLRGKHDLVFIDPTEEQYLGYLRLIEKKLHKGSVVIADNAGVFANQMKTACIT